MPGPDPITSPANPRIKALVRLRSRRERDATGRFLIEGETELRRAFDGGVVVEEVYVAQSAGPSDIADRAAGTGAVLFEVADEAFNKAAVREGSVLGVARCFDVGLERLEPGANPLYLVAAGMEKPGNLGAMLRTAAAAGVDGVIVADPVVDVFNPNVVRGSLGAVFMVPVAVATSSATQSWLDGNGITRLASSASGTVPMWEADLTGPVALVVGSEAVGLGPEWRSVSDLLIPTAETVKSLNASVSAALLLYEAARQRRG